MITKTVIECVKDIKYIYWVKKDLFGCFRIEEIVKKDNETGLKKAGVIEMSTTVLHSRCSLHSLCTYSTFEILTKTNNLF